jgi:hypothetical protein
MQHTIVVDGTLDRRVYIEPVGVQGTESSKTVDTPLRKTHIQVGLKRRFQEPRVTQYPLSTSRPS